MNDAVNKLVVETISQPLILIFVIIGILGFVYIIIKSIRKDIGNTDQKYISKLQENNLCPLCGAILKERDGKYGKFYGCSNYPNCKYTKKI